MNNWKFISTNRWIKILFILESFKNLFKTFVKNEVSMNISATSWSFFPTQKCYTPIYWNINIKLRQEKLTKLPRSKKLAFERTLMEVNCTFSDIIKIVLSCNHSCSAINCLNKNGYMKQLYVLLHATNKTTKYPYSFSIWLNYIVCKIFTIQYETQKQFLKGCY